MRSRGAVLAMLLSGCLCSERLEPVPTSIQLTPSQLDFGRLFVGSVGSARVELANLGKVGLDAEWRLEGEGFVAPDGLPTRAELGSTFVTVRCQPDHQGLFDGQLRVSLSGFAPLVVPLACEGIEPPACPQRACQTAAWDRALGRCAFTPVTDGSPCGEGDACLVDGACQDGTCVGGARDCSDDDPCTLDTCSATAGCQHATPLQCPGGGACQVGVCTPGVGCGLVAAPDGTPCGQRRDCTGADVCIDGACVLRDPPDGFVCSAASPCSGEGTCQGDACVTPPPTSLQLSWTAGAQLPDGGEPNELWSDLFADADGQLTLSSYFLSPPRLGADGSGPLDVSGSARRCIGWRQWVICGDLSSQGGGTVSALDPRSGLIAWQYAAAGAQVPELVVPNSQFFLARLAVLDENALLVLYERRVFAADGSDPLCRSFALVVLDASGHPLRSAFLSDPIFDTCNHPHPYGVATDEVGDIFLAFTPSTTNSPAHSERNTTIFSFTPSLALRWRVFVEGLEGGELSVGQGVLLHEYSLAARSTADGHELGASPRRFGLGVIGSGRFVSAGQTNVLVAGDPLAISWTAPLTGHHAGGPLALASQQTPWGPREVVLVPTTTDGGVLLEGVELDTGAHVFACPLPVRDEPRLLVMTPGALGTMSNTRGLSVDAPLCGDCDPKWAETRNDFARIVTPGLSPSTLGVWSGAWGDPRHQHHARR